jgi:hypothetical protein
LSAVTTAARVWNELAKTKRWGDMLPWAELTLTDQDAAQAQWDALSDRDRRSLIYWVGEREGMRWQYRHSLRAELKLAGLPDQLADKDGISDEDLAVLLNEAGRTKHVEPEPPQPSPSPDAAPTRTEDHETWPDEVRALPIRISSATYAKSLEWPVWDKMATWGQALDGPFAKHVATEEKGVRGVTQGEVIGGGQRLAKNMKVLFSVTLDIESGDSEEDVRKKLKDRGRAAVTYSTFSNGKPSTTVADSDLMKFLEVKTLKERPNIEDDIRRYLTSEKGKGMRPWVVENITVEEGEGFERIVHHAPIDRFRVVLPMAEPFIVKQHGETAQQAGAVWEAFYRGVAKELGVWHDTSCEDMSRFMWLPEHKRGTNNHFINVVGGRALRFEEIEPVAKEEAGRDRGPKPKPGGKKTFSLPWLPVWWKRWGHRARLADFFESVYEVRIPGDGKVTTECPFDSMHSDPCNPNDHGFYARNWDVSEEGEDGEGRAYCKCKHGHHDGHGHTTLDYIQAACEQAGITDWRQLEEFVDILEGDGSYSLHEFIEPFANIDEAKAAATAVEKGDVEQAGTIAYRVGLSSFTPAQEDKIKAILCAKNGAGLSPRTFNAELKRGKSARPAEDETGSPDDHSFPWLPHGIVWHKGSFWTTRIEDGKVIRDEDLCREFVPVARVMSSTGQALGVLINASDVMKTISIEAVHGSKAELLTTLDKELRLDCTTRKNHQDTLTELFRRARSWIDQSRAEHRPTGTAFKIYDKSEAGKADRGGDGARHELRAFLRHIRCGPDGRRSRAAA